MTDDDLEARHEAFVRRMEAKFAQQDLLMETLADRQSHLFQISINGIEEMAAMNQRNLDALRGLGEQVSLIEGSMGQLINDYVQHKNDHAA